MNLVKVSCPDIITFDGTTSDDLITDYLILAQQYQECALRHNQ